MLCPGCGFENENDNKFCNMCGMALPNAEGNTNSPAEEAHASTLLAHLANIAAITGETVKLDSSTGRLAAGSPGAELWSRDYDKGWTV